MDEKQLDQTYIMSTYARQNVLLVKGKGATAWDERGKEYIDFGAGIGVNSLGYCDDSWCQAVCEQAKTLQHASNLYYTQPDIRLAALLCQKTGYRKALFCNSGAEANECAIKLARKYSFDRYGPGRNRILCLTNSFHGRTITTLSATGQDVFHRFFFPFTEGFSFIPANDWDAFLQAMQEEGYCAVMLEFIQGEGGVNPLDAGFVQKVFRYCAGHDILTIADEVQTGIGRTGYLLASEAFGVRPNITSLAKGLGGGLPIGAVVADELTCDVFHPGDHGTTFGGNPVACAGGYAALSRIAEDSFLEQVRQKGERLRSALLEMEEVEGVDGMGLMLGVRLKNQTSAGVLSKCIQKGLLPLTAKEKLRLLPPLTITEEELSRGITILKQVLSGAPGSDTSNTTGGNEP